jgi:multiple antibiotic resistance protein
MVALAMVQAKPVKAKITKGEFEEAEDDEDISIVPLGFPLLAGPGTVSTVIIYADKLSTALEKVFFILFALLLTLFIYHSLKYSKKIFEKLGRTGINVVTRVMGILLVGISMEIITNSIKNVFMLK